MSSGSQQRRFGELLAAREQRVSDQRLTEHREAVARRVAQMARRETRMRRAVLTLGALCVAGIFALWAARVAFPKVHSLEPLLNAVPAVVVALLMAPFFLVPICFVVFTFLYFVRYRPLSRRAEQEQLLSMIHEMERQIDELQRQLPNDEQSR